jgi:mitochondrial cardiolipin hydrolase
MTPQEIEVLLADTLADRRVSGGEKRSLSQIIARAELSNHQRNVLRQRAFSLACDAVSDPRAREVLEWLEEINKLLLPKVEPASQSSAEVVFSPGPDCVQRLSALLAATRRGADLCVFTIADDRLSNAILAAHRRGAAIRILSDDQKAHDAGSDIARFQQAGIPVRLDRSPDHMHHKFAVFDRTTLATGSFNWTRSASEFNQENLVITANPALVNAFSEEFERLWKEL